MNFSALQYASESRRWVTVYPVMEYNTPPVLRATAPQTGRNVDSIWAEQVFDTKMLESHS